MRRIVQQSVVLPAPSDQLFEMYLDPAAHARSPGGR